MTMAGLMYIDKVALADIDCTTDRLILRLKSDGDKIGLMFSHHAAVALVEYLKRETWPLHCAPDGNLIQLKAKPKGKHKRRDAKVTSA
jgi:hypothetical protein